MRTRHKLALSLVAVAVPTGIVLAKRVVRDFDVGAPTFELSGRPIGGATAAGVTAAHLTASRIFANGDGAVVIDSDSGALIKTDKAGKNIGQLAVGPEAGLMSFDAATRTAFVADRRGDRLLVVNTATMELTRAIKTPNEPYGVALMPDKKTVLVTTIADRTLVAYDTSTGAEKWRTPLGREPRGIAVSPDGSRALVAYLTTGTVDQIDLATHRSEHIALSTTASRRTCCGSSEGDAFARASFAVTFMGSAQAIVPFQREVPVQQSDGSERTGSYGGGFEPPVTQQLAFLGFGKDTPTQITATISQHQPRAMAWDGSRDALYVAGLGSDSILQIRNASQVAISKGLSASLTTGKERCGPDGVAVGPDGNVLVWCAFTRTVERVEFVDGKGALAQATKVAAGPTVVATRLTEKQHKGFVTFHSSDPATSQRGSMACSTCHPDNRTDGLSWRIEKQTLQTPILSGRVVGTHPYKWDGGDKTLTDSMTSTMRRLGGFGLDKMQTDNLMAYVESLPSVRTPSRDTTQVARGKALFDSAQLGCRTCHDGKTYQDNTRHKFTSALREADTPSLLGLAASAPYYHDGSAATLEALLRDRGSVHGMVDTTAKLTDAQVTDLTAFLETL